MKAILQFLDRERYWPLWALLVAALVVLPGLGGHGFWEPQEIRIADAASERVDPDDPDEADPDETPAERARRARAERARKKAHKSSPPLEEWLISQGIAHINPRAESGEFGARLPLALLGLVAVLAAFFLGRRLATPRAGLLASLVLVSFPLFILQSRLLLSDVGTMAGTGLTVLGLVGLIWPADRRRLWVLAIDAGLIGLGTAIGYYSAGALVGVVVPFGAVAVACLAAVAGRLPRDSSGLMPAAPGDAPDDCQPDPGGPGTGGDDTGPSLPLLVVGLVLLVLDAGVTLVATFIGRPEWIGSETIIVAIVSVLLCAAGLVPRRRVPLSARSRRCRAQLVFGLAFAGAVAVGVLLYVLSQIFELRPPIPGERALLGFSVMPTEGYVDVLGGTWKLRDDLEATFNSSFEHIAYGLFPWVVLAPIALAQLAMTPRRGRRAWSGYILLAWAALAWIVTAVMERKVGPVIYPAVIAVAVAVGVWLDDLITARDEADATVHSDRDARSSFGVTLRLPLVALFALAATLVLGKDLLTFPDKLLSLSAPGATIKYPEGVALLKVRLELWVFALGLLLGLSLAAGLLLWGRCRDARSHRPGEPRSTARPDSPGRRHAASRSRSMLYHAGRHGLHGAVALGLIFALFLAHGWIPGLSKKLSSKHIFTVYHELREADDELVIMGNYGSGPKYYAGGSYEKISGRANLRNALREPRRVFALVPESELCALHRTFKGDPPYYVLDDSNAKFLLLSNQLGPDEKNRNPLDRTILREPPPDIPVPLHVDYDGRIELIGVDMPANVNRGDTFEMTLFFKVLKPLGGDWKIFVHFDGGLRFQGDHIPVDTVRCSTSYWQPGDYIVDRFEVTAGNISYARTMYAVHVGLYRGSHGNYKNMKVVEAEGPADNQISIGKDDRVRIGQIRVH